MNNEKRTIPGCPNYMVDRKGNVYSKFTGKRMKPFIDRSGAQRINLCIDGRRGVTHYVRRLVCLAFRTTSNPKKNLAVRLHKYRSNRVNSADRLKWGTRKQIKIRKKIKRLSVNQREQIRSLYEKGYTQHDLASKYGVSQPQIANIVNKG